MTCGSCLERAFRRAHGSYKIFDRVVIFYSWRALNAAANINRMRRYRCDGLADIFFG